MPPRSTLRNTLHAIDRRSQWLLPVYLVVLVFATHYPADVLPSESIIGIDKVVHVLAYGVLGLLIAMRLPQSSAIKTVLLTTAIAFGIGLLDEITQPYFNRMCDPLDLLADLVGAAIGSAVWLNIRSGACPVTD
ncbi:VanZ like family protein [Posidoniimonas polymericola]|uniref:VanZ like family protein n=1 Tax=Posidoniimonas polymericola TaxID=2528002 RepID=A0A5C5XRT9_9BACT|nr:VanZ family protein [Posidoniimonas polymericola]TWT65917.1 VanZ like family protein [Posidoniimonas polymericola]